MHIPKVTNHYYRNLERQRVKHKGQAEIRGTKEKKAISNTELNMVQVRQLKALYMTGDWTHNKLSIRFDISKAHVGRILRGEKRSEKRTKKPRF